MASLRLRLAVLAAALLLQPSSGWSQGTAAPEVRPESRLPSQEQAGVELNQELVAEQNQLRDLLSSLEGQLESLEVLLRQRDQELHELTVQSAENVALLSMVSDDLRACTADRNALKRAREERGAAAPQEQSALEQKIKDLSKALAEREDELGRQQEEIIAVAEKAAERENEISRLREDLSASLQQVSALRAEKAKKDQITIQLVRKARESVSRQMELESRCAALANELSLLQQRLGQSKAPPLDPQSP